MRYKSFSIDNYRAVKGPLKVDVSRGGIIPIIGVNECGKTTLLMAIAAFDYFNDDANNSNHLRDVCSLYETDPQPPVVSADIDLSDCDVDAIVQRLIESGVDPDVFRDEILNNESRYAQLKEVAFRHLPEPTPEDFFAGEPTNDGVEEDDEYDFTTPAVMKYIVLELLHQLGDECTIQRCLETQHDDESFSQYSVYGLSGPLFDDSDLQNSIGAAIVATLPHIFYFDDFTHRVDSSIPLDQKRGGEWFLILQRLFRSVQPDFTLGSLVRVDERVRMQLIERVNESLSDRLSKHWQSFSLDDRPRPEVKLTYDQKGAEPCLQIWVIESGNKYFYVDNRSKGFYWFFNFVMRLEFNPRADDEVIGQSAIYLLDEPGSYLHASAQSKLCNKLTDLAADNVVIFCTHSHHLLDPELIPFNRIRIADRNEGLAIELHEIDKKLDSFNKRQAAFQPIFEALLLQPTPFEFSRDDTIVIVEGMSDFHALSCFSDGWRIRPFPGVSAQSLRYHICTMIAWGLDYRVVWDDDKDGRRSFDAATKHFGQSESKEHFFKLPRIGKSKTILQTLFDGDDLRQIKEACSVNANAKFGATLTSLYRASDRFEIVKSLSGKTKDNFRQLFNHIGIAQQD